MSSDRVERGRFVWHELMTTDVEAAKTFYGTVIGWTTAPFAKSSSETPPEYTIWMVDGKGMGGLMRLPDAAARMGAPPHWLAYVAVPDADAAVAEAVSLGGTLLVAPESVPGAGRFAVLQDPQGAVFAVLRPDGEGTPEGDPERLGFSWHELYATDAVAADRFYARLFGWTGKGEVDMGPDLGLYRMFGRDRFTYGGMMDKPASLEAPPHWLHYVRVDSADAAVERAVRSGGTLVHGPMDVPGGDRIAILMDPQGAVFAVHAKGNG